jgi:C1A family cysteine protease
MNKQIILAVTAAILASAAFVGMNNASEFDAEVLTAFSQWQLAQGRLYSTPEESVYRLRVFAENYKEFKHLQKTATYEVALNKFSDMTLEEKLIKYTGEWDTEFPERRNTHLHADPAPRQDSFDWRDKNAMNAVKDQQNCGSCWAFATVASFETSYFLKTGNMVSFSDQQVTDCDTLNGGCRGGGIPNSLKYVVGAGLTAQENYPYVARDQVCKTENIKDPAEATDYYFESPVTESSLESIVTTAPPYVSMQVVSSFFAYNGGVYSGSDCSNTRTNHAVNPIGWGTTEDGTKFWIIRNSWGANWGEDGYFRMAKVDTRTGTCFMYRRAGYMIL